MQMSFWLVTIKLRNLRKALVKILIVSLLQSMQYSDLDCEFTLKQSRRFGTTTVTIERSIYNHHLRGRVLLSSMYKS